MKRWKLLPGLASKRVLQNGTIYYPYLIACIFSVFTYYIFSSILENDLIKTLPYSAYAWMMLLLGKFLLIVILVPFIYYANSFLVKNRKKELGLYTLLGMERKHLLALLFLETLLIYVITVCAGVLFGSMLAKLFFLLLLRLSHLPVDVTFVFTWKACVETLGFFAVVSLFTFVHGAFGIFWMRPTELLSGNKKGEKELRFPLVGAVLGVFVTFYGYYVVFCSRLDSTIFFDFFRSVFLVVVGTYLLFTFAVVMVLKILRGQKAIYYRPENFVTLSGMYYRMKKSAASLANICIFSTMVLITLSCTVSLYAGLSCVERFSYPYDLLLASENEQMQQEKMQKIVTDLSEDYEQQMLRLDRFHKVELEGSQEGNSIFRKQMGKERYWIDLITLADYNLLTGEEEVLEEGQVLISSTGLPYAYDTIDFLGITQKVKPVSAELFPWPSAGKEHMGQTYVLVLRDEECIKSWIKTWAASEEELAEMQNELQTEHMGILLAGADEQKQAFVEALLQRIRDLSDGAALQVRDGLEGRQNLASMNGGLLFIGILFGMIFFMCLLLVMYYKQLSEGYEDQESFAIMQKVGLGEDEIQRTVKKQILTIFTLPLFVSLLHFAVGMQMVNQLMGVLRMFDTRLLILCSLSVAAVFALIYTISYLMTSRAYYKIVKGRG